MFVIIVEENMKPSRSCIHRRRLELTERSQFLITQSLIDVP